MNKIKERMLQFLEDKTKGAKKLVVKELGMSYEDFKNPLLPYAVIQKIHSKNPELNLHWLITGEGKMINSPSSSPQKSLANLPMRYHIFGVDFRLVEEEYLINFIESTQNQIQNLKEQLTAEKARTSYLIQKLMDSEKNI